MNTGHTIEFPEYRGLRCLMMPYVQGDPTSVPDEYARYRAVLASIFLEKGELGYLTIDESVAKDTRRQFLRIVGKGVHGREAYFTPNPLLGG